MKTLLITIAILTALVSCNEPEEVKNTNTIDFTFETEALNMPSGVCANGSLTVELLGETVADNKAIGTFDFNCNSTGKITVTVPVDSWVQITFNTQNTVDEFLTTVGKGKTYSDEVVMFEVK